MQTHVSNVADQILSCCGNRKEFIVDFFDTGEEIRTANGRHPLLAILQNMRDFLHPLAVIPATGLYRTPDFNRDLAKEIEKDKRGVCLRLLPEELEFPHEIDGEIKFLLGLLKCTKEETDLLLDC